VCVCVCVCVCFEERKRFNAQGFANRARRNFFHRDFEFEISYA